MALDTEHYIPLFYLSNPVIDKDTGSPLAGGEINFFRDSSRITPKDVYILSGDPPDYTYVNIGSTVGLGPAGTPMYLGNDVVIYLFPFDGDIDTTTNTLDLYYYTVESSGGIAQFTREGQPNLEASDVGQTVDVNFIPNGQFLLHENLPAEGSFAVNQARPGVNNVAYGGWTYEIPNTSTTQDFVTFGRLPDADGHPRYEVRIVCTQPDTGDTFKDLCINFKDANKFASATQQYTWSFFARTTNSSSFDVDLFLFKNFGTGGSSTSTTSLGTRTITPSYTQYIVNFVFGDNTGQTIGTLDDDFLQLIVRLPLDAGFAIAFTDELLAEGEFTNPLFPVTTDAQFQYRSLPPAIPDYNALDLYLPVILTREGLSYDRSIIGTYRWDTRETDTPISYLPCNGLGTYRYTEYSSDYIPYSRLGDEFWLPNFNIYKFGTGPAYASATLPTAASLILLSNNTGGPVTNTADSGGGTATGFTFATIHTGVATYHVKSYLVTGTQFYVENLNRGTVAAGTAGTLAGFTHSTIQASNTFLPEINAYTAAAASGLTGGEYLTFQSFNAGAVSYYLWITKDGAGADPTPGGTGIRVDLLSTDTATVVAQKMRQALNGSQLSTITTAAASTLTGGDYWTFTTVVGVGTQAYDVWYKVSGAGSAPANSGRITIEVDVLTADTANQVATKTIQAINRMYYTTPDLRGQFIRIWDNGAGTDPESSTRWSLVPGIIGDVVGTFQNDEIKSHSHSTNAVFVQAILTGANGGAGAEYAAAGVGDVVTGENLFEIRPRNAYTNIFIHY